MGHAWAAIGECTTTLLRSWRDSHPDIPLELIRIDERAAGLDSGRVDAAVLRGRIEVSGVRVEPLRSEHRLAVVPSDSVLAGHDRLRLADLVDQTIAINPISGTTTVLL